MSTPKLPVSYAALLSFRSVYSPKTYAVTSHLYCVTVYDTGATCNFVVRVRDGVKKCQSRQD